MEFLHLRLCISVLLEQASIAENNLLGCIMHLSPTMETSTLAQCSNFVRKRVMEIMEKHFIPTVPSSENDGHDASTESTIGADLS
jgi:hypothetical protein